MKKVIFLVMMVSMLLTGCMQAPGETTTEPTAEPTMPPVTRVGDITTETHIFLEQLPYEAEEGQESLYYKKTTDVDGQFVYEVYSKEGELIQLPVADTVLYLSDASNYVERVSFDYEIEGETKTAEQYWLFVEPLLAELED